VKSKETIFFIFIARPVHPALVGYIETLSG